MGSLFSSPFDVRDRTISVPAVQVYNRLQEFNQLQVYLDARREEEYEENHIDSSYLVTSDNLSTAIQSEVLKLPARHPFVVVFVLPEDLQRQTAKQHPAAVLKSHLESLFPTEESSSAAAKLDFVRTLLHDEHCAKVWVLGDTPSQYFASYPFTGSGDRLFEQGRLYPSEVLPQLYISNFALASDAHVVEALHFTHVLNCTLDHPCTFEKDDRFALKYFRVPMRDEDEDQAVIQFFESGSHFIHNAITSGGRILVHCRHGQSRSAAVITAYLVKYRGYSVVSGEKHIQNCRSKVYLHTGHIYQLQEFERQCKAAAGAAEQQEKVAASAPPVSTSSMQQQEQPDASHS